MANSSSTPSYAPLQNTRKRTTRVRRKTRKRRTRKTLPTEVSYQQKDKEWKKVPPKDSNPKEKQVGRFTFRWFEHHMAWTAHKPQECTLNPKHKDYKGTKSNHKAHSAVVASSATAPSVATTLNNCYAALLTTIVTMQNEE